METETYLWDDPRQRTRVIDGVLNDIASSDDWHVPAKWQLETDLMFGGEAGFALALYPLWFAALSARLDAVLEDRTGGDLGEASVQAARRLAAERPAMFTLQAAYSGRPEVTPVRPQERRYFGWVPGAHLTALAADLASTLPDLTAATNSAAAAAA
ncbi:MAG TPA: hypothetical protein VHF26_12195 [Trebonia sp.]|nr:hypothetical protein [Trebonia sp.]